MSFYRINNNSYKVGIWLVALITSISSSLIVLVDFDKPDNYRLLFILPLSFAILSIINQNLINKLFDNLGLTVLFILLYIRSTLLPLLMSYYGYESSIALFPNSNMNYAIIIMVYELIVVFSVASYTIHRFNTNGEILIDRPIKENANFVYKLLLVFAVLLLLACIYITPQLMEGYRTIFQMSEEYFASYEDTQLVAKYGTSTINRFAIVTGNYLMRALLALLPGYFIIRLSEKQNYLSRSVAFLCCLIPLFFIGGVIARSFVYVACLYCLYCLLFTPEKLYLKMMSIIVLSGVFVVIWWSYNSASGSLSGSELTGKINAYFSGVNNVYGSYNLERTFNNRLSYFIYDYMDAIPYSGTIFHSDHVIISEFFNKSNGVRGQIPTTIGMGRFYFGPILAPLYSGAFTFISVKAGEDINRNINSVPLKSIRLLLTSMYFAMGIVMYNISITLTTLFTIILPVYMLEKYGYQTIIKGKSV